MKSRNTLLLFIIVVVLGAYLYFYEYKGAKQREEEKTRAEMLIDFKKEDVTGIALISSHETIECHRDGSGEWKIVKPVQADGDKGTIEGIINTLHSARRERIIAETDSNLTDYGLKPPEATLILSFKSGKADTLLVGNKNPTKTFAFVKLAHSPKVLLTSSSVYYSARKKLFDLRDKHIIKFSKKDVNKLVIHTGKKSFAVEKIEGIWTLKSPIETRADADTINKILNRINSSRVKEFVEEHPEDLTQYGLAPPAYAIDLYLAPNNAKKTLFIGKKKDDKYYYARDESRSPVFLVSKQVTNVLKQSVYNLRDKQIVNYDKYKVNRIEWVYSDSSIVCAKDTSGSWNVVEPVTATASQTKQWKINNVLSDITRIRAKEFVAEPAKSLNPYGLAKPQLIIRILDKDSKQLAELLIGKEYKKEMFYVTNQDKKIVFAVKRDDIKKVKLQVKDLIK